MVIEEISGLQVGDMEVPRSWDSRLSICLDSCQT